jgi:hypothetical protein
MLLLSSFLILSAALKAQIVYQAPVRSDGEVRVYVTKYRSEADLIVFKSQNIGEARASGNAGVWYFTDTRSLAEKRVYITDIRADSDITIAYTDIRGDAGWRNPQKKKLMEKK